MAGGRKYLAGPNRGVTAQDGSSFFPGNPEVATNQPNVKGDQYGTGVFPCDGAISLIVDVVITGAPGGTSTLDLLAWNPQLLTGVGTVAAAATGWVIDTTFTLQTTPAVQRFHTTANQWAARFGFLRVTSLAGGITSLLINVSAALVS